MCPVENLGPYHPRLYVDSEEHTAYKLCTLSIWKMWQTGYVQQGVKSFV